MTPGMLAALLAAPLTAPPPVLTVAPPAVVSLEAGGSAEARFLVTVREGYHVQANPAAVPYLIPLSLELGPTDAIRTGPPVYPPGEPYRLRGASSDLSVYGGSFDLRIPVMAQDGSTPGESRLSGALRYQACSEHVCLRPASAAVELTVKVVAGRARRSRPPRALSRGLAFPSRLLTSATGIGPSHFFRGTIRRLKPMDSPGGRRMRREHEQTTVL
jgi:hypothetical protein